MEGHKLRVLLLPSHNKDGETKEWKKEIKYNVIIMINIKLASQAASLEETRMTMKRLCQNPRHIQP
jgi:hypothetical protein